MYGRKNLGDYTDRRWKPSGVIEELTIADISGSLVYIGQYTYYPKDAAGQDRFWVMCYHGKAGKPDIYESGYRSREAADKRIEQWKANMLHWLERTNKGRQERKEFKHGLREGMILTGSWGYDQTNVEYYKVAAVRGKTVEVVKIGAKVMPGSDAFNEKLAPNPDHVIGKPIRKIVQPGNYLSFECFHLRPCGIDTVNHGSGIMGGH